MFSKLIFFVRSLICENLGKQSVRFMDKHEGAKSSFKFISLDVIKFFVRRRRCLKFFFCDIKRNLQFLRKLFPSQFHSHHQVWVFKINKNVYDHLQLWGVEWIQNMILMFVNISDVDNYLSKLDLSQKCLASSNENHESS